MATNPNPFFASASDQVTDELKAKTALINEQNAALAQPPAAPAPEAPVEPAPQPSPEPVARGVKTKSNPADDMPPPALRPVFEASAKHFDIPVNVLMAIGHQESRYNANAVGQPTQYGTAKGMMQNLDATAKGLGINAMDPNEAIPAAAKQIRERLDKGYSMEDAVKEHFAGPDRKQWGAKTEAYGAEVMDTAGRIGSMILGEKPAAAEQDPNANRMGIAQPRAEYEQTFRANNPTASPAAVQMAMTQYDQQKAARGAQKIDSVAQRFDTLKSPEATFDAKLNQKLAGPAAGVVPALPGKLQPAVPPPAFDEDRAARESEFSAAASYLGKSFKSGVYDLMGAGAKVLDEVNPFTVTPQQAATLFKDDPKELRRMQDESVVMVLSRFAKAMSKNSEESIADISDRAKRDYGNLEYATTDTDKAAYLSPVKVIGDAMRSLPTSAAMAVSVYLTRGAAATAERTALAAGLSAEAAKKAGIAAGARTMATAGAASEGTVGYAQQALQTAGTVAKMSQADIEKSPQYQELLKNGYTPQTAREQIIADTGEQAGKIAGIVDAAVNQVGGQFLGKILSEGGKLIPRIMKGVANESATEFVQSAGEQAGENLALKDNVNPNQDLTAGVGEAAVAGAAVGGLMGGVMAGAGGRGAQAAPARAPVSPLAPTQNVPVPAAAVPDAPISSTPLTSAVNDSAAPPARVVVTNQAGSAAVGTVAQYEENDAGGFTAQIVGDDGQVYTITDADGVQLAPVEEEAGPLSSSIDAAAEEHAAAPAPAPAAALAEVAAVQASEQPISQRESAQPAEVTNGTADANDVQPDDVGGRSAGPVDGDGRADGRGDVPAGVDGGGRQPADGGNAGLAQRSGPAPDAPASVPTDEQPALTDWKRNPYSSYQAANAERAQAYMDKKGADPDKFEVRQTGAVRWQIMPKDAPAAKTKPGGWQEKVAKQEARLQAEIAKANASEAERKASRAPVIEEVPEVAPKAPKKSRKKAEPVAQDWDADTHYSVAGDAKDDAGFKNKVLDAAYSAAYKGRNLIDKIDGVGMLAAKMKKTGYPIFITEGKFGRDEYKKALAEARDAGLDAKRVYVYADSITYTGPGIEPVRIDSLPGFGNSSRYSIEEGQPQAEFGPVHAEYRDDAAGAVKRLMDDKSGEAIVHRDDVGDVSLVYGDGKMGLSHIAERRGAAFMARLPELLRDGTLYSKPGQKDRVFIGTDRDEAVLRFEWDGKAKTWLLSAYEKYPDLKPAGAVQESRRSETVEERSAPALSIDALRQSVTRGVLGKVIGSMIDAGLVVLHTGPKSLPKGVGANVRGVQAATTSDGKIHLVASNLTAANARAVMLHEAFHEGAEKLLGTEQWGALMGRVGSLYRQGEQSTGKAKEFFDKARKRVAAAKAKGGVATKMEVEEFAAYAIEEYESAPASVRKWVDDLIAMVKAWMVKRFGKQIGQVTPAQLSAMARWALMDHAVEQSAELYGDRAMLFSMDPERSAVSKFADQMREKFPGLRVDLMPKNNGDVHLSRIVVPLDQRNSGTGTAFMQDLAAFADENGLRVVLSPSADFGGSKARLIPFYKRFGFVENKGRNKDFSTMEAMYREPAQSARFSFLAALTDSPAFKRWFGKSKVVDAAGEPLVVYHGGAADMTGSFAFDPKKMGINASAEGYGFYFTTDQATASGYKPEKTGSVVDVYLSMQKPMPVGQKSFSLPDLKKIIRTMVESEIQEYPDEIADYKDGFLSNYVDTYSTGMDAAVTEVAKIIKDGNDLANDQIAELANAAGSKVRAFNAVRKITGFDGIVSNGYGDRGEAGGTIYVAWFPEQIKGATGNSGGFDPSNPDIRYSVAGGPTGNELTPAEQGRARKFQELIQDNINRVRQVQKRIEEVAGVPLSERNDYVGAEINRPGRIAARLEDAESHLTAPLMERLAKSGYTQKQLSELLHAMHAKERNEVVAKINPKFPDGGSGMTNDEAEAILTLRAGDTELHAIADQARAIAKATLDLKLAYENIKQEDYDTYANGYEFYVPLKGDGEYGPKVKRAMGHDEREEYIVENIARDYQQAVIVGEKNLARQSLARMMLQNPDPELWSVGAPPKGRYVAGKVYTVRDGNQDVATFTARSQVDAFLEGKGQAASNYTVVDSAGEQVKEFAKPLQDNEVMVYFKGDPVRLQFHDKQLANQIRPLNQGQMGQIMEFMRGANRYLSKIYTGYNPAFILRNVARDLMTGTINMLGNNGAAVAAKAYVYYLPAINALGQYAATGKPPAGKIGNYMTEYRMNGGKTGASWMSDFEQQGKTLERLFDDAYGAVAFAKDGRPTKAAVVAGRKFIGGMAHVVEIANQATENGLRLSLYIALREKGATPGKAAQAAKSVTVDFDRKGTATGALGALYLFFNPAVQGTANAIKALSIGKHRGQAWAALGGLAALGAYAASAGLDDDKDRWLGEGWDLRTKNLILNIGDKQLRIPLSQEYAPAYALGVALAEARSGESKMRSAARLVSSFIDAYFPFQGAIHDEGDKPGQDFALAMTPTIIKPAVTSAFNRNSFGSQIVPETETTKDRPDNLKMNRGTKNTVYDKSAQGIASLGEMMGAGKYENDITKVSPETLKMLWRTYTGGLGQFVTDTASLAYMGATDSKQLESGDYPFLKDFVKTPDVKPIQGRYYDLSGEARKAITEFQMAKKLGDGEAQDKFMEDATKVKALGLTKMITKTNKAVGELKDEAVEVNADTKMSPTEKRARLKELEREQESLYRDAIEVFKQ